MKVNLSIFNSNSASAFVARAILFLLLFLMLDQGAGALLGLLYKKAPHGANWTKVNWLLEERFDVVIFGSSRAFRHYVPHIIEEKLGLSVFNAGQNGQYMCYAYALEQLMFQRHTPKIIVLDVTPNFIVRMGNPSEEFERLSSLSPFISNDYVRQLVTRDKFFEKMKYVSRTYRYNSKILSILDNIRLGPGKVDNGFEPVGDVRFHARNGFLIDAINTIKVDSFKLDLLREFVHSAQEKNVKVVAVFSPVAGTLNDPTLEVIKLYDKIFHSLNVPFYNFARVDSHICGDKNFFMDFIHLDQTGAEEFSMDFAAALAERDNPGISHLNRN